MHGTYRADGGGTAQEREEILKIAAQTEEQDSEHGSEEDREPEAAVCHPQILITSYDLLKRDIACYETFNFRFQVIDEAQYIKNPLTQSAKSVKLIKAKTRYALTGTPIENRLSELWSIFDYLMRDFIYLFPVPKTV